ncbi:MAG TPA: hypothetical protein VEA58_05840, partial [Anaerovoracaceae bacterium]|nr:hypothetical protein [Anaerovoracaceae bacterium]
MKRKTMQDILTRHWGVKPFLIESSTSLAVPAQEMAITEVHTNDNGATGDLPAFCFVLDAPREKPLYRIYARVSLAMLKEAMG